MSESVGEVTARIKMRNLTQLLFLPIWVAFLLFGLDAVIGDVLGGNGSGLLFLVIWVPIMLFALGTWLWVAFGVEVVSVGAGMFTYKRELFGYALTERIIPVGEVSNLRAPGVFGWASLFHNPSNNLGFGHGSVAVDQGWDTHRFGILLEEKEAAALVATLKRYLPEDSANSHLTSPTAQ